MKKIFTLLSAVVVLLSANAAPAKFVNRDAKKVVAEHVRKAAPKAPKQLKDETITITANNLSFSEHSYYGIMNFGVVIGSDADWSVSGYLFPEGSSYYTTYSTEAKDIELSVTSNSTQGELELTVSAAELKTTAKGDLFTASAVDSLGRAFEIQLSFFAPEAAKDTIAINFGSAEAKYYADSKDYYIYASNNQYVAALDIFTSDLAGTYTYDDFDKHYTLIGTINGADTTTLSNFYDVKATIVLEAGVYNISAEMFGADSIFYQLSMTYTKPVATDTISHTFLDPVTLNNYGGDYYFRAIDNSYILVMDYYSKTAAGEFGLKDLYTDYVGLFAIHGTDTTAVPYEDIKLSVVEEGSAYAIEVYYLGSDKHCYHFSLTSPKTVANDTVQITLSDVAHRELPATYASYYGFTHYILAAPTDSSYVVALAVVPAYLEGSFETADINLGESGIQVGTQFYMIEDAKFTGTHNADGTYTLKGWFLAKNNTLYEFEFTTAVPQGIENTEDGAKAVKYFENGQLIIEKNGVKYNAQGVRIR